MQPVIYSVVFFRIDNSWPLALLKGNWHLLIFQQCVLTRSITTCLSGIHSDIVTYLVHPRFKHKGIEFPPSLGYDEEWDWPLIVSWDFQGPNLEGFSSLLVLGSENSISPPKNHERLSSFDFSWFCTRRRNTWGEVCLILLIGVACLSMSDSHSSRVNPRNKKWVVSWCQKAAVCMAGDPNPSHVILLGQKKL